MKLGKSYQLSLLALVGFMVFYFLLFVLFPIQNAFIGNSDTIVHVSYFYEHLNSIRHFFMGQDFGHAYYPESGIGAYMETYYGETLLFFLAKLFTWNDVWACFLLYVWLFALNGWAVYLLSYYYTKHRWSAFVAGLIFSSSCFMMSTLELMNGVVFFCIPISIYFLERFIDEKKYRYLAFSTLLLSLESLFSAYHFFMGSLVWLVLMLTRYKHVIKFEFKKLAVVIVPAVLIIIPLFLKIFSPDISSAYNPMQGAEDLYFRFSMSLKSFVTSIPGNLIYPRSEEIDLAVKTSYRGNLGIICLILFLIGITRKSLRRYTYLIILLVATLVSFGPYTFIGGQKIMMPTAFIYNNDFFGTFFRMPGRAFVISNFIIALFCGIALKAMLSKFNLNALVFSGIIMLVFVIENQAIPPYVYQHDNLVHVPEEYELIQQPSKENNTIADLPSSLFTETGYVDGVSEFTREYRYHYWQTKHHFNTINGSASYYPMSRMENNELMMGINLEDNLQKLIDKNELDFIFFHKDLVLFEKEKEILVFLEQSPLLNRKSEGERMVIFSVIR